MGGRIDCYLDVVSLFSYVGFTDLMQNLDKLADHGVKVDFIPVFLGGINNLSGNQPPWVLPARGAYLQNDSRRAMARVGIPCDSLPDLMTRGKTLPALRALHYVKANYSEKVFLNALQSVFVAIWTKPHANPSVESDVKEMLAGATAADGSGKKLFAQHEVDTIMEKKESMKEKVKQLTSEAVERGAFGAPWLWVTNDEGKKEAFFGSDRFNHVYRFLGIPFQDVAILPPSKL